MPKLLIFMKYGEFADGEYAPGAERQIRRVAKHLESIIGERSTKLISSTDEPCVKTAETVNAHLRKESFASKQLSLTSAPYGSAIERFFFGERVNTYDVYILVVHEAILREAIKVAIRTDDPRLRYQLQKTPITDIPYGSFLVFDCSENPRTVKLLKN